MSDVMGEQTQYIDAHYLSVCSIAIRIKLLVGFVLVLAFPLFISFRVMTHPSHTPTVEIHDWASVIRQDSLKHDIEKVKFYRPIHIGVLTLNELIGQGLYNSTREYAQQYETKVPWISPTNPDQWADGVFLISIGGIGSDHVMARGSFATYFGQDIAQSFAEQSSIEVFSSLRMMRGSWQEGTLLSTQKAAEHIGKPWYMNRGTFQIPLVMTVIGAIILGKMFYRRITAKLCFSWAEEIYVRVNDKWEDTAIQAQTIDSENEYGAAIRERYRVFTDRYYALTQMFTEFGTPDRSAWYTSEIVDITQWLQERASSLEEMNRAILNAANFLNMNSQWRNSWDNEVEPVVQALKELEEGIECEAYSRHPHLQHDLREELRVAVSTIGHMTAQLSSQSLMPSDALKKLDQIASWAADTDYLLRSDALLKRNSRYEDLKFWRRKEKTTSGGDARSSNASGGDYDPTIAIRPTNAAAMWDYGSVDLNDASSNDERWMDLDSSWAKSHPHTGSHGKRQRSGIWPL